MDEQDKRKKNEPDEHSHPLGAMRALWKLENNGFCAKPFISLSLSHHLSTAMLQHSGSWLEIAAKRNHVPAKILQFARFHLKMNCVAKWKLLNYRMHMKEDQTNCCFYPNKLNFITSGALLTFPKRQWQAKQCTIVHLYHWNQTSKRLIGGLLSVLLKT